MFRLACLVMGYLIGCIQTAYITGRLVANIDIRDHGSGNAGFTNVNRVLGAHIGIVVFVIDVLKGILVFLLCSYIFNGASSFTVGSVYGLLPGIYGGLGVVLGHNYPFLLKFRGGKGVASSLGLMLCLHLPSALIIYAFGIMTVIATRFISAASLLMLLLLPILLLLFGNTPEVILLGMLITAMGFFQHRENIDRLIHGKENKFSFKKRK